MTQEEKLMVEKALASSNPTQTIAAASREIVMNRIDCQHYADRELRFLVKDIIEATDFGCEVKVEQFVTPGSVTNQKPNMASTLVWGSIGLATLIGTIVSEKAGLRGLCGLVAMASSFFIGRSLIYNETVTPATIKVRLVSVTTVDEVVARLDRFTASLMSLFDYRQIEGTHKDFLCWLQSQYADSTDKTFRKDVRRLLGRFNYRLEDYSDARIADFEISEANVDTPVTTVPALFTKDNRVLLKGHYVVPVKN